MWWALAVPSWVPKQDHRKVQTAATFILGTKVKGAGGESAVPSASLLLLLFCSLVLRCQVLDINSASELSC